MSKKILFFQTAFLGDLFLSIPSLKYLRSKYPDHELSLYCRKPLGSVFLKLGLVDKVFEVDKADAKNFKTALKELKSQTYDLIFTPHPSFRSAWMTLNLKSRLTYGFNLYWYSKFYNKRMDKDEELPEALRQLKLVTYEDQEFQQKIAEIKPFFKVNKSRESFSDQASVQIPNWASLSIKSLLPGQQNDNNETEKDLVLIAPGSVWPTKRWTEDSFVKLGQLLAAKGFKVGVMGAPNEAELCATVSAKIPGSINVSGRKLLPTLQMMSDAKLLVANDSGSIHMAASVDLPVVSVFGPTTPALGFRPWVQPMSIVQLDLNCRPCGKHGSHKCPLGTHECMKSISAEMVLKECKSYLNL